MFTFVALICLLSSTNVSNCQGLVVSNIPDAAGCEKIYTKLVHDADAAGLQVVVDRCIAMGDPA